MTHPLNLPTLSARAARWACLGLATALLGACAVTPAYQQPDLPVPAAFKEAGATWAPAAPADALDRGVVAKEGITMDEARARRITGIPAGRYGTAEEFGAACAFLCSRQAGFIVGQNILLDGGAYPGTF